MNYQDYFTTENIITIISNLRANESFTRHKEHFFSDIIPINNKLKEIYNITPPRRMWIKLGKNQRNKMSPTQANALRIKKTIHKYYLSNDSWIINLKQIIKEIKELSINSNIQSPRIAFLPKDNITFRPLTLYPLKDHIYIGLLAKYVTTIYDDKFSDYALAFRSKSFQKKTGIKTYHQIIKKIVDYRKKYKNLYVAECDIKAFYDSVEHETIKKIIDVSELNKEAKKAINNYLKSYNFNYVIEKANKSKKQIKKPNKIGNNFGIPQGGAISCVLSNLVLDYSDNKLSSILTNNDLYFRYCDDIIIISPNKKRLTKLFNTYLKSLKDLNLDYHKPIHTLYNKDWYEVKSKSVYNWSKDYPWINFLGYQIHYSGKLRIRKKSIEKEKDQQKEFIAKVIDATTKVVLDKKIFIKLKSKWFKRIVGLSFSNFNKKKSFAWSGGFKELKNNEFDKVQIKQLDLCWNNQIKKLKKVLNVKSIHSNYHKFEYLGSYYNAFEN